ncbi:unnamed protein product [Urochloa decumbens]|uniref:Uncharacterized protein n=1 Tax=Urochloa decumbens TaxID=240449 RepID=A0ABC9G5B0_9POAL
MLPKQAVPVAPPRDAPLVHRQRLVAPGEAVGVVEQAPRHEPAGDDGAPVRGSFRLADSRVPRHLGVAQLPDATAPRVPVISRTVTLASARVRQYSVRVISCVCLPSVVLVQPVELIVYVNWLLHILGNLQGQEYVA